jgi:hypothetical protein
MMFIVSALLLTPQFPSIVKRNDKKRPIFYSRFFGVNIFFLNIKGLNGNKILPVSVSHRATRLSSRKFLGLRSAKPPVLQAEKAARS